jgi:hypothetical protein
LYVDTTGNDNTGDGTAALPYASVTKALSAVPGSFRDKVITINVSGEYHEDVVIRGFSGVVNLYTAGITRFRSLLVEGCSVYQHGSQLNFTNGIRLDHGATYVGNSLMYVSSAGSIGINVRNGSTFVLYNTATLSNTTSAAMEVSGCSYAYVSILAGASNTTGIRADTGGTACYGTINITATTRHVTNTGGRIYSGAQASIPSY